MTFYAIRFLSQPRIKFACSFTERINAEKKNIIDHRPNQLELFYWENISTRLVTEYESYIVKSRNIGLLMPDCRYEEVTEEDCVDTPSSIAIEVDRMEYERFMEEDVSRIADRIAKAPMDTFFIPQVYEPEAGEFMMISSLFKNFIHNYSTNTASGYLRCLSVLYEILALIDTGFRSMITALLPDTDNTYKASSSYYYVYKAKKYICAHCCERLSLRQIADTLGITPTYFSYMFKKETGKSVVDYINFLRMQRVRELITQNTDLSFSEVCAMVGLHDLRYVQRLFKKTFGVSMQRCRQLDHGITLYHTNPWHMNNVDHDLLEDEEHDPVPPDDIE